MADYLAEQSRFWLEIYLPFKSLLIRKGIDLDEIKRFKDKNPNSKVFLIQFEESWNYFKKYNSDRNKVLELSNHFDLIFTSDRYVVDRINHARWSPLAECWTNGSLKNSINRLSEGTNKEFSISFLNTAKSNSRGGNYLIRRDVWNKEKDIIIPTKFYDSVNDPINDGHPFIPGTGLLSDKIELYKSMYNICFENIYSDDEENFSQRLIDCFINKTIPIYRGYNNIGKHFNMDGIIYVHSAEEAIEKINKLTPEYYKSKYVAIEDNYNRVIKNEYNLSPGLRIERMIRRIYNLKPRN